MLDSFQPLCDPTFLDSGAYSVFTGKWDKLPIDSYIKFTSEYHKHFCIVSVPDVIGDLDATIKNTDYFVKKTKCPKDKIANVYHVNSGRINKFPDVISQTIDAGLTRLSIGGLVGYPKNRSLVALEWIYNYLAKNNIKLRTHIFGGGDPLTVKLFRPDSIDSASFIHAASGFSYFDYDYDNWKITQDSLSGFRNRRNREFITSEAVEFLYDLRDILKPVVDHSDDKDYIYKAIEKIPDSDKILLVNGLNVRRFEKVVREKLGYNFEHYVTYHEFCSYRHPYVYNAFREVWRERSLNPYFKFWSARGRTFERLIKVFGESK